MNDEIRDRLARIDPMHSGVPTEDVASKSSRELLEGIMSTPTIEREERNRPLGRSWVFASAAALALIVAVGGAIALSGNGEDPAAAAPLVLTAGGEDQMAMCIQFSVEELAKMPMAFEGTVTAVDGSDVTLSVDHWFKGGDAETVLLDAPQGLEALIGGIPFESGEQYLITAYDGQVNYCGFSGPSTPEFRASFAEAFGD
jgi:hypothetical protein